MYSSLKGNVSIYQLDQSQIASMIDGMTMPQQAKVLVATIGITFIGPNNLADKGLPDMFKVRRLRVKRALEWLKENNLLFSNIVISMSRLAELPEDDIPYELWVTTKISSDLTSLYAEQDGYVSSQDMNNCDSEEGGCLFFFLYSLRSLESHLKKADPNVSKAEDTHVHLMNDCETLLTHFFDPHLNLCPPSQADGEEYTTPTDPAILSLSHLGVVDVEGLEVTDTELMAHALTNCCQLIQEEDYLIQRGSAFVNEYVRVDPLTKQRNDGRPGNTNHLLGTFPTLFLFGQGGNMPYKAHV